MHMWTSKVSFFFLDHFYYLDSSPSLRYDMSALNIILGKMFNFEEGPYVCRDQLFGSLLEDRLRAENKTLPQNQFRPSVGRQLKIWQGCDQQGIKTETV